MCGHVQAMYLCGVVGYVAWILFSSRFALWDTLVWIALIIVCRFATLEMIVAIAVVLEFCLSAFSGLETNCLLLVYTVCSTAIFLN